MSQLKNSMQLIVGLGKTGLSCAEYLNDRSLSFRAIDTRDSAPFTDQISQLHSCQQIFCANPDLHLELMEQFLDDVQEVIVSPGVAISGAFFELVAQKKINIIGDIELFSREAKAPIVAITGSNGKSTVTELTAALLAASGAEVLMGGNIGIPALQLLKQHTPDYYVLELSSFQLETTHSLRPLVGTVLNITADHLDRYQNFEAYCAIKMSLLADCEKVVINQQEFSEHQRSATNEITISASPISTIKDSSTEQDANYYIQPHNDGSYWITVKENTTDHRPLLALDELKIVGSHNVSNAMAALALCEASGVDISSAVLSKLKSWPGLRHRCEYIGQKQGVRCYNDSKATNVAATLVALAAVSETVQGELILIAGGDGKGADFSPLASAFKRYISALILIGKDAEQLLEQAGNGLRAVIVGDMKQAVSAAFSFAKKGDSILLSPACASLDMYKNFQQRGDCFIREVEAMI